jgi:site-specific recombinase
MDEYEKERARDKKIAKIMKRAGIALGAGFALFFLTFILPEISDKEKMGAMKTLLSHTGLSVAVYGGIMSLVVFFLRPRALLADGLMNWLVVPSYALWFAFEAYKVLAG